MTTTTRNASGHPRPPYDPASPGEGRRDAVQEAVAQCPTRALRLTG